MLSTYNTATTKNIYKHTLSPNRDREKEKHNNQITKMALSSKIAAALTVLVVVLAASSRVAEGQQDCASKLVPCAAYLNSTTPSAECCSSIKEVVTTQLECLCRLYANPGLLPGINMTQALMIPKYCNLSTDTNACKTALSPRSSPPAPPAPGAKDNKNDAGSISWVGIPAFVLASALTFLY
ncbi:PREDICTED: non-specific lipid-transfer protein 1-like isoform X2 [Erythranthe guttata]|uniref:non-specific lipid-transfer protein 1-like isoform X2 n=1 Tax=Erythranthe guttata TaxID=4155 RepID=UPI00064DF801|nr:PREDICTED: non-specific lipid-transfer protein 1-like isoform X2 [Erythranthe guttata]|eukprot:XP_012852554.1 PREDICTED: non-specific lipid-transfer protein 1-like isoform X2 [Erythranthe guttata]